jgi:hypothetical protein
MRKFLRAGLYGSAVLVLSAVAVPLAGGGVANAVPDTQGTIYVADAGSNAIDVFAAGSSGNVAPTRVVSGSNTGLSEPGDVKVDAAGDVFAVNFTGDSIVEFAPQASGNVAPTCTLSGSNTGLRTPDDMSLEADGTLVVGNFFDTSGNPTGSVEVFAPGSCGNTAPLQIIEGSNTNFNTVDGVGTDAAGNIYADSTLNSTIEVFPPGANGNVAPGFTISGSNTGLGFVDDLVVGFGGQLYATNGFKGPINSVTAFAPGAMGNVAPTQNIVGSSTGLGLPDDLAVDSAGNIFVTDSQSSVGPAVLEYASGATGNVAPIVTLDGSNTTFNEPEGVAIAPPPAPTFTTLASASQIVLGTSASDTATIGGNSPTGSIVFKLFGPGDATCSNAPAFTSAPQLVAGNGSYTSPLFAPVAAGTYSWEALYSGDVNNAPVTTSCSDPAETFVVKATTVTLTGTPVSAVEGQSFAGPVASFTDTNGSSTAGEFSATIDWGDGVVDTGTVSGPGGGPYTVTGTHTYAEEGTDTVKTSITDSLNFANDVSATSTATVSDAAISASCAVPTVSLQSFSGPVATLTDTNPGAPASDFTATIDWGDSSTSAGTVTGPSGGPFTVSGTHTYATTGVFTVTASIVDDGGSTASTSGCSLTVFAFAPGGGAFVIGDGNSATGTSVEFWGAQWRKHNSLSGGLAPASFKGFAADPTTPSCGVNWTTDPGNSTPPPDGPLPSFMGVIVTSHSTKSGPTISGDTVHIVVVQTNPGYAPNPGHRGTGTVVAQVC